MKPLTLQRRAPHLQHNEVELAAPTPTTTAPISQPVHPLREIAAHLPSPAVAMARTTNPTTPSKPIIATCNSRIRSACPLEWRRPSCTAESSKRESRQSLDPPEISLPSSATDLPPPIRNTKRAGTGSPPRSTSKQAPRAMMTNTKRPSPRPPRQARTATSIASATISA